MMPRLSREAAALVGIAAFAALGSWVMRHVCDDAYISFRYARHLVEGHGLVYNLGEPAVEGYTNFLWTMLIAGALRVGIDPPVFVSVVSAWILVPASLLLVHRLSLLVCCDWRIRLGIVGALALDPAWTRSFTSGLETGLATTLVLAAVLGFAKRRLAVFSLVASAAALTRPDTVVLLAPLGIVLAWQEPRRIAILALPATLVLGPFLAWKLSFYGALIPNTAVAKANDPFSATGVWYLVSYFSRNVWLPALVVSALVVWRCASPVAPLARTCLMLCVVWCAYIVAIGGDFMEFRMMAAMLAIGAVAVAAAMATWQPKTALAALLVLAALNDLDARAPYVRGAKFLESSGSLAGHVDREPENWLRTGQSLRALFPDASTARIAVSAAGVIPYESRLFTIDMHGLTDRLVARTPRHDTRPGHGRLASWDYLVAREVALVIGHPRYLDRPVAPPDGVVASLDDVARLLWRWAMKGDLVGAAPSLVSLPVSPGKYLLALYLTRHPEVDRLISEGKVHAVPIKVDPRRAAPHSFHTLSTPHGFEIPWRSAISQIGWSLLDSGHAPLALYAFAATQMSPGMPGSWLEAQFSATVIGYGRALRAVGRAGEAAQVLAFGAAQVERNPGELLMELALAEAASGRCDDAMRHVRKAMRLRPRAFEIRVAVAHCLTQAGSERVLL